MVNIKQFSELLIIPVLVCTWTGQASAQSASVEVLEHGEYLLRISGCNDCHTPGYIQTEGQVGIESWLTGDILGWRGPWGTTYAPNLRLLLPGMTEQQWLAYAKSLKVRPPMPWFNLNKMKDEDLIAIYQFVVHLGPAGEPAPDYLPPEKEPPLPYFTILAPPPE